MNDLSKQPSEPSVKTSFHIKNWHEYDKALINRGSLTFWLDQSFAQNDWIPERTGKVGRPTETSNAAIQAILVLKQVFRLPYRQLVGMTRSLLNLMHLDLPVPVPSHLSRRAAKLHVQIPLLPKQGGMHLVIDSTGLKVYGEGEWKVRQHGVGKRRTWVKMHLGVDAESKGVVACEVTTVQWGDSEVIEGLLEQVTGEITHVSADGAYDTRNCHQAIAERGAKANIPPKENAVRWAEGHPRNTILDGISQMGRAGWKRESGYHRRSLAENAMYRVKQIFGDRLSARKFDRQVTEVHCRLAALNMMSLLGMPISVADGRVASKMGMGNLVAV
jgi:hypothetical protein